MSGPVLNIPLKADNSYALLDAEGMVSGGRTGLFRYDTRLLSRLCWSLPGFDLVASTADGACLRQHWSRLKGRDQDVGLRRALTVTPEGLRDRLDLENTSLAPQAIEVRLEVETQFADIYEASPIWGFEPPPSRPAPLSPVGEATIEHVASDGVTTRVTLQVSPPARGAWSLSLAPGEQLTLSLDIAVASDLDAGEAAVLPNLDELTEAYARAVEPPDAVARRSLEDVAALLTSWRGEPVIVAGVPWFVTLFGRDSLLTAFMLLRWAPWLARNVCLALAASQGRTTDAFREEEPGKIGHNFRRGELARTGRVPFGRYYGTADATALFVITAAAYRAQTGDDAFADRIRPAVRDAVGWCLAKLEQGGGFVRFAPAGRGLAVQSWKDSPDSMSHATGELAAAPMAPVEVQGYVHRALLCAADLLPQPEDTDLVARAAHEAAELKHRLHASFWLDDLQTFAMALDAQDRPLAVLSSNPGHLLWAGAVDDDLAPRLAATLLAPALWSGWGLRTLGSGEARYNPISYHNGGIWPPDTALFAGGTATGWTRASARCGARCATWPPACPTGACPNWCRAMRGSPACRPSPTRSAAAPRRGPPLACSTSTPWRWSRPRVDEAGRLRVGVIGAGAIARNAHLPNLAASAAARPYALASFRGEADLSELASRFGVARVERDWRAVAADPAVDAVVVATANASHAEVATAALEAGKAVFVEKPVATSVAAARAMVDLARARGLVLAVNLNYRRLPAVQAMAARIADGGLGPLRSMSARLMRRAGAPAHGAWFVQSAQAGGGASLDLGSHMVDLALWLTGFAPTRVVDRESSFDHASRGLGFAAGATAVPCDVDDGFALDARTADVRLRAEAAWAWHGPDELRIQVIGAEGGLDFAPQLYGADRPLRVYRYWDGAPSVEAPEGLGDLRKGFARASADTLEGFFARCRGETSDTATGAEALAGLALIAGDGTDSA